MIGIADHDDPEILLDKSGFGPLFSGAMATSSDTQQRPFVGPPTLGRCFCPGRGVARRRRVAARRFA